MPILAWLMVKCYHVYRPIQHSCMHEPCEPRLFTKSKIRFSLLTFAGLGKSSEKSWESTGSIIKYRQREDPIPMHVNGILWDYYLK